MAKAITVAVLSLFLCTRVGAKDMLKKKFIKWSPQMSAPFNFPVAGEWLYVKYGFDSAVTPYLGGTNLLQDGMAVSHQLEKEIKGHVPKGTDLLWDSWTERKWYQADINFSRKEKKILKNALLSTFPSYDNFDDLLNPKQKNGSYDIFNICIFPGGKIRYYLESSDYNRRICLDGLHSQAKEIQMNQDFLYGGSGMRARSEEKYWDTMDEYFDEMLLQGKYYLPLETIENEYDSNTRDRIEYYRKHGAPNPAMWDPYFKRYNYRVAVLMEDSKSKLWSECCHFTNAEMYERFLPVNPDNVIDRPSPLANMDFKWDSAGYAYAANLYFNEEETFAIFQEAFNGQDNSLDNSLGELRILVGKNNDSISASLIVNGKSYSFNKIQMDIERCREHYLVGDYIYKNYKEPHQKFVGR